MTKAQILILLIILALVIYYLNQETKPPRPIITQKKPVIKPILPITNPKKSSIPPTNSPSPPHSPIINFPSDISIPDPEFIHCPATTYEPEALEPAQNITEQSLNPDEHYRQKILTSLEIWQTTFTNPQQKAKITQAINTLETENKPRYEYLQILWNLKSLDGFKELISQPLKEWINLPVSKPTNETDHGWLTDDNLEFILSNHPRIQEALTKQKQFTLRTDIANIYNAFQRAKDQQEWDLPEFLQELEWNKAEYTLFPLRVSGDHWGLFILQDLTFAEECSNYQVYYTSSGKGIESEVKQLKPFISQITELENNIQILQGDKQQDGYNCGVYLIFCILELLETGKLELKKKYTSSDCQEFRWEWKSKIGGEKWCKWD
ncbi:hypothetical protein [endosymbiont GvMRE of Glomus versiforme]|uniref:hypothetical protein n=1 Tax=endosymbiont GvMRE of Glomus versiforme TaxID=2039283 RepID=UPI000EEF8BF3|nr:hypothetical protein [endosymbiont GvMRE of Glomus versiforme]RHZ36257.1 hypothetical protein GvMRE_Ic1g109 [endosymbiont GvMRE of Glomus versiforme]